ncbi:MAG: sugar transferase [Thermotogota bacterium]|nr:sugar transferase [Thermotogota bacterium]
MQKKLRFSIFIIDLSFLFFMFFIIEFTQPQVSSKTFLLYSITLLFFFVSLRGYDAVRIASPRWTMTSLSISLFLSHFLYSGLALFQHNHLHMDTWGYVLYFLIFSNLFNPFFYRFLGQRNKETIYASPDTPKKLLEALKMNEYLLIEKKEPIKKNTSYYQQISSPLSNIPGESYENIDTKIFKEAIDAKKGSVFFTRVVDIILSLIFLLILSPFFAICSLLLLIFQGKPIIYKQTRIGQNEQPFTLYKFRTLKQGEAKVSDIEQDHLKRSTGIGRFLRSLRLDELPQLINCTKGDMSLVGPRPEMPYFHELCKKEIPNYTNRLLVKPGITGWAQTMYKRSDTLEEYRIKTGYDFYFLLHYSVGMYFKSLLYTLDTLVYRKE